MRKVKAQAPVSAKRKPAKAKAAEAPARRALKKQSAQARVQPLRAAKGAKPKSAAKSMAGAKRPASKKVAAAAKRPAVKKSVSVAKAAAKKMAANQRPAAKKAAPAKRPAAKKPVAKVAAKKSTAKKVAPKKVAARTSVAKKPVARPVAKKAVAKAPVRPAAKKAPPKAAKKVAPKAAAGRAKPVARPVAKQKPAPKPLPKAKKAVKAAPVAKKPVPKPSVKAAPKAAVKPAPKAAPKPAPRAAPKVAPKPLPKAPVAAAPKAAPAPKSLPGAPVLGSPEPSAAAAPAPAVNPVREAVNKLRARRGEAKPPQVRHELPRLDAPPAAPIIAPHSETAVLLRRPQIETPTASARMLAEATARITARRARDMLPVSIQTRRLVLRAPIRGDVPELVKLADNRNIAQWLARLPSPYTRADAIAFVEIFAQRADERAYAITLDGTFIGVVGFSFREGRPPELGYWLGEPYWGQGYMTEAVRGLVDAAHATGLYPLIGARCRAENAASIAILEKTGFKRVGKVDIEEHAGEKRKILSFELEAPRWA